MLKLSVTPLWETSPTTITIDGDDEAAVVNVLVSRLSAIEYEILIEDEDGDFIPFEDFFDE